MNNTKMLYFDRIDIFQGIDVNKKLNQKSGISVTNGIFQTNSLIFNQISATDAMIYLFNDIAMLSIKRSNYCLHYWWN